MYETDLPSASHSVVVAARNINEYYLRVLRQAEMHRQMFVEFENRGCEDYETNHQAFQILLGRPFDSSTPVSATDVWKCCAVLDNNYGFGDGTDGDWVTSVVPMRDVLANLNKAGAEAFRANMLKISIRTAQKEFAFVAGLDISNKFALLLCGYPCLRHTHNIPESLRLKNYGTEPPPFRTIRKRFSLAGRSKLCVRLPLEKTTWRVK